MRFAIVEDNQLYQQELSVLIKKNCQRNMIEAKIDIYSDGSEIVNCNHLSYDVIYFDIKMQQLDGMTAAKQIRTRDSRVLIVFCTSYIQYAIDGYAVNATDFLIKPISNFAYKEHFKKLLTKLETTNSQFLTIKLKSGIRKVNLAQVLYIKSEGHYIAINTEDERIMYLETMRNLEKLLEESSFFRCNKSYFINLQYVLEIVDNTVMINDIAVPVSRGRKKQLLEALTKYLGDDI